MSEADEESFFITWRIKNFSMCPQQTGTFIESPAIRITQFGNSEWTLRLHPKGTERGFISCFLHCNNSGIYEPIYVKFSFKCSKTSLSEVERMYRDGMSLGYVQWLTIENALESCCNDTFELKLSMKYKNPKNSKNTDDAILESILRNSIFEKDSLCTNKCCIETIIQVQNKIVFWPIKNYQSLTLNKRIAYPVISVFPEIPTYYLTLIKTTESTCIEIKLKKGDSFSRNVFVRCSVSVDNAPKGIVCGTKDEFFFEFDTYCVWELPAFLSELDEGYFKHTNGVLYLFFDFAFSAEGKMDHYEINYWDPVFPLPERKVQLDALKTPTAENEFSIVSLRTGDKHFKVHKSILSSNSEVFSAMFENDMIEKNTSVADILDVDPETLGLMVAFFYTGTVGDLSVADCEKLYAAADKYQVLPLMDLCSSSLMSSMTVSNVCCILFLADLYENDRLMKCAEDFIIRNSDRDRILISSDWKELMNNNPSLTAKIMYKMLIK